MIHSHRPLFWAALPIVLFLMVPGTLMAQVNWPANGRPAAPAGPAVAAQQPYQIPAPQPPFELTPAQQQAVDKLLTFWERYSGRVQRYNCSFTWWEYDSNFGPRDPNAAKTCSEGQIQYEAPDKGLFRVDKLKHYTPQPDGSIQYLVKPGENGTYWTCNGKEIFDFNFGQEQLEVTELPPDMQGSAIANGPLPFLFGAKAETIKQRYWVQIIAPPQGKEGQEHWLQAFPKTRQDAANYKMVEVILDAKLFLPSAIQVYDPSYDGRMNFSRSVFVFHDRKVNERFSVQNLNPLKGDPFTPKTPQGWKRIVRKDSVAAPVSQATPPPQSPDGQAARQPLFGGSRQ